MDDLLLSISVSNDNWLCVSFCAVNNHYFEINGGENFEETFRRVLYIIPIMMTLDNQAIIPDSSDFKKTEVDQRYINLVTVFVQNNLLRNIKSNLCVFDSKYNSQFESMKEKPIPRQQSD